MQLEDVFSKPVAHRGLHDLSVGAPENSPSAFRRACELGVALECDLQLSRDGVPMVIHDAELDRTAMGSGRICDLTANEIGATRLKDSGHDDHVLRFSELLELVAGRVAIAVELKPQIDGRNTELANASVEALENYNGALAFISFAPDLLRGIKTAGFEGPTGIVVERFVSETAQKHLSPLKRFAMRHLLHYPSTRFDFVDCDHKALDLPAVRLFRAMGFPVAAWTVRSQDEADIALEHCDQIAFEGFIPRSLQR